MLNTVICINYKLHGSEFLVFSIKLMIHIEHFNIRLLALYYGAFSQTDFMVLYFMFIYFITFCYKSEVATQNTQVCAHVKFIFNILNILKYYKIYDTIYYLDYYFPLII